MPVAVACFVAYACSGHKGIYLSQRVAVPKRAGSTLPPDLTLRDARALRPVPDLSDLFAPHPTEGLSMSDAHHVSQTEIGWSAST